MGIIVSLSLLVVFLALKKKSITKGYILWCFLLVFYLSVMLSEVVGFPNLIELNRLANVGEQLYNPSINRIPFSAGFDISSLLNIVAFIPLGIALVVMWKTFKSFIPTFFIAISFSFMIEIGQLFTLNRQSDVNDLIMNTLGVIIGWLLAKYVFKWQIQRNNGMNLDWVILIFMSLISVFIFG